MDHHLAQVNIAKMKAALDSPIMAGFVQRLDEINTLADNSNGFVWRFQNDEGNATYLRPFDDDMILFNMSVWKTLQDLKAYVYQSNHLQLIKSKANWFSKPDKAHLALWWIPKGHIPTVNEGIERLRIIQNNGPGIDAFTFATSFSISNNLET